MKNISDVRRRAAAAALAVMLPSSLRALDVVEYSAVDRYGLTTRSLAAGRAGAAIPDDPGALLFNPAALPTLELKGAHLFTAGFEQGARFTAASYAGQKAGPGSFGAGYMRLDSGEIPGRQSEAQRATSYSASDQALVLGYGLPVFGTGFLAGGSARFRQKSVGGVGGGGFGADAGLFRRFASGRRGRVNAGLAVQDLVPMTMKLDQSARTKPSLRGGASLEWPHRSGGAHGKALFAWEAVHRPDAGLSHRFGGEYDFGLFAARAGYEQDQITFGLGTRFAREAGAFSLDYALVARELAPAHTFSLSWYFGVSERDRVRLASRKRKREEHQLAAQTEYEPAPETVSQAPAPVVEPAPPERRPGISDGSAPAEETGLDLGEDSYRLLRRRSR
jgi:hypothetical protein